MELEGNFKDFSSFKEALAYLKQYDYGYLNHSAMERDSFVFLKTNGRPYWFDSTTDKVEALEKADLVEFNDPKEWPIEDNGKLQWGYVPGGETALANGGEEWFRSLREAQAMIESFCVVGTTIHGQIELIDDLYTYPEAMAAVEILEGKKTKYVGFDIFTESRFDNLVKKLDGYTVTDHMEDDLVDQVKSKRQKKLDDKKEVEEMRLGSSANSSRSTDVLIFDRDDIIEALCSQYNLSPNGVQADFPEGFEELTLRRQ